MARKNSLDMVTNLIKNEQAEFKNQIGVAVSRYDYIEALKAQIAFNTCNRFLSIIDACKTKGKTDGKEN